jgi:hypothetical protein
VDAAVVLAWTAAIGGDAETPGLGLGIEIGEIGEITRGEEGVPHKADGAFDAAHLVAAGDRHRSGFEVVVDRKRQQGGMEADGIATPFQHRAFKIIVE